MLGKWPQQARYWGFKKMEDWAIFVFLGRETLRGDSADFLPRALITDKEASWLCSPWLTVVALTRRAGSAYEASCRTTDASTECQHQINYEAKS